MSTASTAKVDYPGAAKRHFEDAIVLESNARPANAGQLFGVAAECGVKAILIACGVLTEPDGTIGRPNGITGKGFRDHMPQLPHAVVTFGHLVPDGRAFAKYSAAMPDLRNFHDWTIDQRYWGESHILTTSVPTWKAAAGNVLKALDLAIADGVM